jgi:hypothetical protein
MRFTCEPGPYDKAIALIRALNAVDNREKIEAGISVGGVWVWVEGPDQIPSVQAVCKLHKVVLRTGPTATVEDVLLQDPNLWDRLAKERGDGNAVLAEWEG